VPQPRAKTSKLAMAHIQRLCCLGIGSEALMPDPMCDVMRLVPSRGGWFFWLGSDFRVTNAYSTFSLSTLEVYFKEFHHSGLEKELLGTVPLPLWPTKAAFQDLRRTERLARQQERAYAGIVQRTPTWSKKSPP
jgi:hypothetical protein